jgi:Novel STAND NTPase 1/Helix-turn-helix domain
LWGILADDNSPHAGLPDPGRIANQRDFGRMLTLLRERAGKTIRQVAAAADIPPSTAGDYFTGSHLPHASARSVLPRILAACGEADPGVTDQWLEALARARRAPGRRPAGAPPPYRGLASFQAEDAQWFFGRDDLIRLLVSLTTGSSRHGHVSGGAPGDLPVVVIGPSGAGKSSLLRAGLMPALRERNRSRPGAGAERTLLFTPGSRPLARLAKHLAPEAAAAAEAALRADPGRSVELAGKIRPPGLALIVDQFEDTYTDCQDEAERQAFIAALCALCGPAMVVLGLRADFYARALAHPQLARALRASQIAVGPMTAAQLRQAIVEPARLAGLQVDHGLVELLLRDLAPQAGTGEPGTACDAGALALLSNALLATWERSRGKLLTVAAYEASGGIREAIAAAAETAYSELPANQRGDARRLLLRLVQVTDGVAIRRRIPIDELSQGNDSCFRVSSRQVGERRP